MMEDLFTVEKNKSENHVASLLQQTLARGWPHDFQIELPPPFSSGLAGRNPILVPDVASHYLPVPGHSHSIVNEPEKYCIFNAFIFSSCVYTMKNAMFKICC